jgi:plastocyanin
MFTMKRIDLRTSAAGISVLLLILFSLISVIPGCSKNDMSTNPLSKPSTNDITIQGMAFSPANKTITVGTTIKWTNQDGVTHTITSGVPGNPTSAFDSGNLASNGSFSHTFNQAGTYKYYCKIHTTMTGTITVQSGSGSGGGYGGGTGGGYGGGY